MTSSILSSPLKQQTEMASIRRNNGVSRALFSDDEAIPPTEQTLSEKYQQNLDRPSVFCNADEFFSIQNMVEAIDIAIAERLPESDKDTVIERVTSTLKMEDYSIKMAELGLILFYIDRDLMTPSTESLIRYRAEEMNNEVCNYIEQHTDAKASSLIPTGKTHYILRALSHMIMTSEQKFNKGGGIAINCILETPELFLSQYLQPEHRQHILTIVNELIHDEAFQVIIGRKAIVHPDLENLIRIDLKLHPSIRVQSAHIIYDVLMALFADIRQKDNPNCYAVAALIYTTENYTHKFVEKTLKWLEQGYISISDQYTLPLKPLVDKRLVYLNDLSCLAVYEGVLGVAPIEHIRGALKLEESTSSMPTNPISIRDTLSRLLKENDATELLPYAEQLYVAYKYNTLILLHLTVVEMTYMNGSIDDVYGYKHVAFHKRSFIATCINAIGHAYKRPASYSPIFINELRKRLTGTLWLENCNEQKIDITDRSVILLTRDIYSFQGNSHELASVFRASLRVFAFDNNTYEPIDKITDLQRTLINAVTETERSIKPKISGSFRGTKFSIIDSISSHRFRVEVTNYCSDQINRRGIRGVHLNRANLLLLKQVGGKPGSSLKLVYDIDVTKVRIEDCDTPYQLIANLQKKLPSFDQRIFESTPKVLLFTPGHHIWTLNPKSWSMLLAHKKGFYNFIQETVFDPVRAKLRNAVPQKVIKKIIEHYTDDFETRRLLAAEFKHRGLSYQQFINEFPYYPFVRNTGRAIEVINACFSEIHLTKRDLSLTLKKMNIQISSLEFHKLFDSLPQEGAQPYILARTLRQKMIEQKIAIVNHYDVERTLCQVDKQPISFLIGDSNWLHKNTEDPYHLELCIGYDYGQNTLVIKVRYKNNEKIEDNRDYREVEIQYPPVLLKSDRKEPLILY